MLYVRRLRFAFPFSRFRISGSGFGRISDTATRSGHYRLHTGFVSAHCGYDIGSRVVDVVLGRESRPRLVRACVVRTPPPTAGPLAPARGRGCEAEADFVMRGYSMGNLDRWVMGVAIRVFGSTSSGCDLSFLRAGIRHARVYRRGR